MCKHCVTGCQIDLSGFEAALAQIPAEVWVLILGLCRVAAVHLLLACR